ncbi:hypothetical protein F4Z98_05965 [Candidatus Poribacteria bacterium]|nr:hypothetical protein [Candidatus Poribacteria bacterium]MYB01775.1 hypothetical protein [Candidatus Poribacteria bacterium]MYI36088.1 hypothetical protein [Acidimicrobiaceae bacterium]
MAKNRYGRIYHSDHNYINLRFPSVDARREFAEKFEAYHASHDHDGEVPRFENEVASKIGNPESTTIHDAHSVSIDGYATYEIEEYHNPDAVIARRHRYTPPTCCVAPVISVDRTFVDSDTLTRHELSAIFTDIPDEEFASMLQSIERDGFMDPIIRLIGTEVLDGWHRYSAAKELNLLRKLKFQQWDEKKEGDPAAFVYARNQHRRHKSPAERAQITVLFNERYGRGANRYTLGSPNGESKTRKELAKEAGVGTSTIDRAIAIEKEGQSEAVIKGEKTAGEVIKARDVNKLKKRKKQVLKNLWDKRKQAATDWLGEEDNDLTTYLNLDELEEGFANQYESYRTAFLSGIQRINAARNFQDFQDRAFEVDEFGNAKVDISELEEEYRAIMTYGGDIRQWKRPDWSPDTNWILPLIEAKKKAKSTPKPEPKPEPSEASHHDDSDRMTSDDLKTLREKVKAQMSKYKEWYKDTGYKESDLISRASFSQFIHGFRVYMGSEKDGAATANELQELLDALKRKSYPFAHKLRQLIRPEQPESDDAPSLGDKIDNLRSEIRSYLPTWKQDNPGTDAATFFQVVDARFRIEHGIQRGTGPFFFEELEPLLAVMKNNDLALADKVREMLGTGSTAEKDDDSDDENRSLNERMDRCRADLIEVWQQAYTWEGLEIPLYAEEYGFVADVIEVMQREIADAHPAPTSPTDAGCQIVDESDEDTSLAEIDNLPAVKYFLETLFKQVGAEHPIDWDGLSIRVFEALTFDALGEDTELTEREQLALLIDVAYTLVAESM